MILLRLFFALLLAPAVIFFLGITFPRDVRPALGDLAHYVWKGLKP